MSAVGGVKILEEDERDIVRRVAHVDRRGSSRRLWTDADVEGAIELVVPVEAPDRGPSSISTPGPDAEPARSGRSFCFIFAQSFSTLQKSARRVRSLT